MTVIRFLIVVLLMCGISEAGKYGSGSRTVSTQSTSKVAPPSPSPSKSTNGPSNTGTRSKTSTYDSAASSDQRNAQSQQKWNAYQQQKQTVPPKPVYTKPVYTTPNGKPVVIPDNDSSYWKGRLDQTKVTQREDRRRGFYASQYSYLNSRPRLYYDDHYDSNFSYWLRVQPVSIQAQWIYNHQYDMDSRRYSDFMTNVALSTMVSQLASNNPTRNRYWCPTGMDADLMYTDSYVEAAVAPAYVSAVPARSGFVVFMWVIFIFTFLAIVAAVLFNILRGQQ